MRIQRAAVIGAGTMGAGIAQVLSQAGIEVILKDVKQEFIDKGITRIKRMYESRVKKEVLTQAEADYLLGLIKGTTSFDAFKDVDLVIEAALEEINVKLDIFKQLDAICPSHAILASNTSALSVSEIAACTKRPEKVVGMHFFNPAQTMKLVEVIPGLKTSKDTVTAVSDLCRELKKIPVTVQECPGFLVNRLLFPYLNEALYVAEEGIASLDEVDRLVVEFGMPMGPYTLLDMTGIDICANVNNFLYDQYGPRFEPAQLINKMVAAGFKGQKSGAGFFIHDPNRVPKKDEPKKVNPELAKILKSINENKKPVADPRPFDVYRVILPMFNEAIYAIQEQVVVAGDVDVAMQWGCGMTKGLLTIAEHKGLEWCLKELKSYEKIHGERFRPAWLLSKLVNAGIHDFTQLNATPAAVR